MLEHAVGQVPYIAEPKEIGRGGFATVFLATDRQAGRQVAVKLLSLLAGDTSLKYFDRERASLARLSTHPNVVTLHRTGVTTAGVPYLVMEYASGGSLADRLKSEGPMPWADAVRWVIPVCDAVQHANEQGIRHRDIKPENILISAHGEPLLSDFGIAELAAVTETFTQQAKLSLSYASPEQIEGRELDDSTDVYSLGATLFTLLAGAPAFADTGGVGLLATAKRILEQRPPPLPETVPTDIADAVAAAMAKNPAHRPTIGRFRRALLQEIRLDAPPPGDAMPDITKEVERPTGLAAGAVLASTPDHRPISSPDPHLGEDHEPDHRLSFGQRLGSDRRLVSLLVVGLLVLTGSVATAWANRGDTTNRGQGDVQQSADAALSPAANGVDQTTEVAGSAVGPDSTGATGSDQDGDAGSTATATPTTVDADRDGDGTVDVDDNCPELENRDQANSDGDASGDRCDPDDDNDGVPDEEDNCQRLANRDQVDVDRDGLGDACDDFPDRDGDGIVDTNDSCIEAADAPDSDEDGIPDRCDPSPRGMAAVAARVKVDRVTVLNVDEDDGQPDLFGDLTLDGEKFGLPEISNMADIRPGNWVTDRVELEPGSPLIRIRVWIRDEAGFCLFCKDGLVDVSPVNGLDALQLVIDTETGSIDLATESWSRLDPVGTLTGSDDGDLTAMITQVGDDDDIHRALIELSVTLEREPVS